MFQQLDIIKDSLLHHDHLLLIPYVLFSHALSSCFVTIFADLYYDHVYRHGAELHTTSWSTINRQFGDVPGSVLALIDMILTILATSVEAKRGCSVMKRVKTDYRNKLRNPSMNDLLRIILLSPSEVGWMKSETFYEYVVNILNPWLDDNGTKKPVPFFIDGAETHLTLHLSNLPTTG